jgi:hypothetical protein
LVRVFRIFKFRAGIPMPVAQVSYCFRAILLGFVAANTHRTVVHQFNGDFVEDLTFVRSNSISIPETCEERT